MPGRTVSEEEQAETLLGRVALRDRDAFRRLYERTSPHLFGVAIRILGTRALAEEALQDAFVQIWQRAGSFQSERAKASTWMTSIVRYRSLDLRRVSGRELALEDHPEIAESAASPAAPEAADPALGRCLELLAQQPRDCLSLAFVGGYSHPEISRKLNTPLGTVKSWIRRGLQQLKECLEP
jgi:RNA polymerase sigma-70 factor, ECF subfamily